MQTLIAFLVALGILILVHELGHYLVARLFDVKVTRFSIGFGRPLVMWKRGQDNTEWIIAAVPFGGYVKMLDEREEAVHPSERHRAFNRQMVWRRFLIVAAGPIFNFLLAIALYWGLHMYGVPEARPIIAQPADHSPAAAAGFRAGSTIRSIDGEHVSTWRELRWHLVQAAIERKRVILEVVEEDHKQGSHLSQLTLDLRSFVESGESSDVIERLGFRLERPLLPPVIGQVVPDGPAARGGLQPQDLVTAVNGQRVESWSAFVAIVRQNPASRVQIDFERSGRMQQIELVPDTATEGEQRVGRIGAALHVPPDHAARYTVTLRHGPIDALTKAISETWNIAGFSLRMFGKMLVGEVSWRHLSGPVTIADVAGQSAQMGWMPYLTFLALISISLGILNLLPIPLLDGGHLMFYLAEALIGRPVPDRFLEISQRIGVAILVVLMAFALYNDLHRLLSG